VKIMAKETELICIMCPLACRVTVTIDDEGNVTGVTNNLCKEGEKYAIAEYKFPGRVLTTTLLTTGASQPLLPARSSKPIPKTRLVDAMYSLSKIRVKPPVKMAQVVASDVAGTGVDMISTDALPE
jgi:CxxC motif-containing protein